MNHPGGITAGSSRLRDAVLPVMAAAGINLSSRAAQRPLVGWRTVLRGE
jgi:hypothetical protein